MHARIIEVPYRSCWRELDTVPIVTPSLCVNHRTYLAMIPVPVCTVSYGTVGMNRPVGINTNQQEKNTQQLKALHQEVLWWEFEGAISNNNNKQVEIDPRRLQQWLNYHLFSSFRQASRWPQATQIIGANRMTGLTGLRDHALIEL